MLCDAMPRLSHRISLLALLLLAACAAPPPPPPSATPRPAATSRPSAPSAPSSAPTRPAATPVAAPTSASPSPTPAPSDPLFDPRRLSYDDSFTLGEAQAFLDQRGSPLAGVRFQVGDRSMAFAHTLTGIASLYSLNPKLLLALAELHSRAVTGGSDLSTAFGFPDPGRRGLYSQLRWAARELRYALRDYDRAARGATSLPPLIFADASRQDVDPAISMSRYVLARVMAPTTVPGSLGERLDALTATYARLFDDPRLPPTNWPAPAAPFLSRPMEQPQRVTSFFDHDTPWLVKNGSLNTFWGRIETDSSFAYDGHTGWDYAMAPPDRVLAAADGTVIFAGNSDDGCATPARAVVIDHGNGYRTLYWHLARVSPEPGQQLRRGDEVGIAGETGCAIGPHLHFQVQYLGRDVDPYGWCGAMADPWAAGPAGQVSRWLWEDMPSPCEPPPPGVVVVDDGGPGFFSSGDWQVSAVGYGGGSRYAAGSFAGSSAQPWRPADLRTPLVAAWRPDLPRAGRYRVLVYIPYALNGLEESQELRYLVRHQDGETAATVDAEAARNWWADLGTYAFDASSAAVLSSTLAGDSGRGIWVDAVAFVPAP